jgi:DNA-binding MarR family transcriptional regulator
MYQWLQIRSTFGCIHQYLKLTAVGHGELQQIRQSREEMDEEFFAGLDNEEQETLHRLLVKLFISLTQRSSAR